jgi:FtsZ-binding cell division protein ZapB
VWHSNSKNRKTIWQCNHKFEGDCRCQTPHLTDEEIPLHFLLATNKLLATQAAVIANGREMQSLLFDTTELEAEKNQLLKETQVASDMVQQAIQENARTALNQTEYQKRYDSLVQRFDRAKSRLEDVAGEIQEKQTDSANMDAFLKAFDQMPDALTEFSLESWHSIVDFATVYGGDDIRFTFKNGQELQA